jgi:hypothetical protein
LGKPFAAATFAKEKPPMARYTLAAVACLASIVCSVTPAADGLEGWSLVRTVDTDRLDRF